MTFYNIGTRLIEENPELLVCEWEIDEEGDAELISITNKADTKSYEEVNQIINGPAKDDPARLLTYKLGNKRTLGTFQAVWLTRKAMPIYGGKS